ncbi:hypothetical protein PQX77_020156 [Marasmius sp. AFHP31]|nr:hypothetical protein PQX77_020156 [Marasmius sp. AFHP31]
MSQIALGPASASIPGSKPNLMPFHIEYSGKAPISTFLHVQDAKKVVGAPEPEPSAATISSNSDEDSQKTQVQSQDTLELSASSSTLVPTNSTDSQPPTIENDLPDRFISTFRGRAMHGLSVDVPEGFTGVVLRSEGVTAEQKQKLAAMKEKERLKAAATKRKEKLRGKAGEVVDTPSRATRSSLRKTNVEDVMDVDEDEDEDETVEDEEAEDSTQLNLVPASQFSSFVLWHPDIPVDTGKDEYYGTISEWMKISHLVCLR